MRARPRPRSRSRPVWAATALTSSAPCRTWRNADDLVEFVRLGGGEVIGDERTHQLAGNRAGTREGNGAVGVVGPTALASASESASKCPHAFGLCHGLAWSTRCMVVACSTMMAMAQEAQSEIRQLFSALGEARQAGGRLV